MESLLQYSWVIPSNGGLTDLSKCGWSTSMTHLVTHPVDVTTSINSNSSSVTGFRGSYDVSDCWPDADSPVARPADVSVLWVVIIIVIGGGYWRRVHWTVSTHDVAPRTAAAAANKMIMTICSRTPFRLDVNENNVDISWTQNVSD